MDPSLSVALEGAVTSAAELCIRSAIKGFPLAGVCKPLHWKRAWASQQSQLPTRSYSRAKAGLHPDDLTLFFWLAAEAATWAGGREIQ